MAKKKHTPNFLPFVLAVLFLAGGEVYVTVPTLLPALVMACPLINLAAAWWLAGQAKDEYWYNFFLLPTVSAWSIWALVTISNQPWLIHGLLITGFVLFYLYWRYVFFFFYNQSRYLSFSLENLSFYINLLTIFCLGSAAFGLRFFLSLHWWQFMPAVLVLLLVIVYQNFWAAKLEWQRAGHTWLVVSLLLGEMFFGLTLLPHDHNLLGLMWAVAYYVIITLSNDWLTQQFKPFKAKVCLGISLAAWVLLLATAGWQ